MDLACGKGRHSITMNQLGYKVEGLDISPMNIQAAQSFENVNLKFTVHDMRDPFRESYFGLILNLFTSFGYFDTNAENMQVLDACHFNLKPKGRLLIDYFNVHYLEAHLVERDELHVDDVDFRITRKLDGVFVTKKIEVLDGGESHIFEERVMAFDKQHLCGMLTQAGFEILEIFGNHHLEQFHEKRSERLIIAARKIQ